LRIKISWINNRPHMVIINTLKPYWLCILFIIA